MISVLLWKEYREHRMVWIVLAIISGAAVLWLSLALRAGWLGEAHDSRIAQQMVAAFLVAIYALICGAMLLAGERENRTLPYLDGLPGWRRQLWLGKLLSGVVLVLAQAVFLMALCAALLLFASWKEIVLTFGVMTLAGFYGLSWGMLFSSFGRSVMNVILLSVGGYVAWIFVTGLLAGSFALLTAFLIGLHPAQVNPGLLMAGLLALTAPAALIGSALIFTRLDRNRLRTAPESVRVQRRAFHSTWSMLFWLTWRQARGFAVGLTIFALFLGLAVLIQPFLLWPAATLLVGVLCGATAFADEQQGSFRFLGDQRLPLGRLWIVKVGVRFAIAVAAALVVLAPSFIAGLYNIPASRWDNPQGEYHFLAHVFHSDLLVGLCPPLLFLTLWLVYGFTSGCLFGLLFRNGLAAGVFALFTCSMAAAIWIPSLLGGGLHAWQVFGPPVLILFSTPLLMRPWAAGRIGSWTTALRLIPFVLLAALWIAGGLWYRVLEIPYVPQRIDLDAFRASLPMPEQNQGGRLFHSACLRFHDLAHTLESQQVPQGGAPGAAAAQPPAQRPMERAADALDHGWPADDRALAAWMDKLYAGDWVPMLKQAADLPTGPFDDVRSMTFQSLLSATQPAREVAVVLAVRGLQRQAASDDEAYVENLRVGLGLSRSLRDHTPMIDVAAGRLIEGILLRGVGRWLEGLRGRADLIRQALATLSRHLDETAFDSKDQELVEDLITKNSLENPLPILQAYLTEEGGPVRAGGNHVQEEAEWVATAWFVPWEHARQDRILRVLLEGDAIQQRWLYGPDKGFGPLPQIYPARFNLRTRLRPLCSARAMQLALALRWFQADHGKPAENLDQLVPKYLSSIPLDPYDGEPFRYRLSRGEEIVLPSDENAAPRAAPSTLKIPPGQGVLWSVGEDKRDDGGHRQAGSSNRPPASGEDIIFLVPLPPNAK